MAEELVRNICKKSQLKVSNVTTRITGTEAMQFASVVYKSTLTFLGHDHSFEITIKALSYKDAYNKIWKECFKDKNFGYYVRLLNLTEDLGDLNLYHLD